MTYLIIVLDTFIKSYERVLILYGQIFHSESSVKGEICFFIANAALNDKNKINLF